MANRVSVPPPMLVFGAVTSLQVGAAIAKGLFESIGPAGTVWLRVGFAAVLLLILGRPRLRGASRDAYLSAVVFGLALGGMNLAFYSALDRIPLGVAVTLEFIGPLGVAAVQSRRLVDFVWATFAILGILLLAPVGVAGSDLDPVGVALALLAGALWAAYILLTARVGRLFAAREGLVLALIVATIMVAPVGLASGGSAFLRPEIILAGLGVAVLSSALPYSLELAALRRMPTRVFGILMASEPAVAAVVGWLALNEAVTPRMLAAIVCVTVASVGVTRAGRKA